MKEDPKWIVRRDPDGRLKDGSRKPFVKENCQLFVDEIYADHPRSIHIEVMSDQVIWCCIEAAGQQHDLHFGSLNGKSHIRYEITNEEPLERRRKKKLGESIVEEKG